MLQLFRTALKALGNKFFSFPSVCVYWSREWFTKSFLLDLFPKYLIFFGTLINLLNNNLAADSFFFF